jgi:hypothetical protein
MFIFYISKRIETNFNRFWTKQTEERWSSNHPISGIFFKLIYLG